MRKKAPRVKPPQDVYELCQDSDCPGKGTHWHPFRIDSLEWEEPGEYTITVRVGGPPKRPRKAKR